MANLKITQLPSASIATGSNVLPIVQGGATDQITVTNLGQGILNLGLAATFSTVHANNNSSGTNFKVGDDAWIGDVDLANTMQVAGVQDATKGFIKFSSGSASPIVGSAGSNLLQITGSVKSTGGITAPSFTGSFLGTASYALGFDTSSLATTGSNTFTGDQIVDSGNSLKVNLINNVSTGQQITIDPDGDNNIYINLDGFDDGGERLEISNQFVNSAGIYYYLEGGNYFRMYQNQLRFPDDTWQTTAYPGSGSFVATSSYGHFGNFYSTQSQYNPTGSVSQSLFIETDAGSNGVTVVSGSRLTVANTGIYNLQFSTQFEKSSNGVDTVYIWFKKNGDNIADSATSFDLAKQAGGGGRGVAAWNFITPLTASDYLEIVWQAADTTVSASYLPVSGNIPAIPSTIVTLTQIS